MAEAPATQVIQDGASATQVETETPEFKVFVGNLAYSTTDEGLKAFFAPVENDILSAHVILRGTRSAGYGFVALSSAEAAQKAVEALDKKELDGRSVVVETAKPADQKDKEKKERRHKRRPGRRGSKAVPGEVSEAEANGDATKPEDTTEGNAEPAKPKKKKKKPSRKAKKVKAEGEVSDAAPPATEGEEAEKKKPRLRRARAARPPRPAGEDPEGEPSKTMLFVANLGFNIDDAELASLFTDVGITVVNARIVRRSWGLPTRRSKGYGFVDVGSEEQQKKAIELLQGKDVGGRPIAVKVAVNTPQEENKEGVASTDAAASPTAPTAAAA